MADVIRFRLFRDATLIIDSLRHASSIKETLTFRSYDDGLLNVSGGVLPDTLWILQQQTLLLDISSDARTADAKREAEMRALLELCERAAPLPKGTRATPEARFYRAARESVPLLVKYYLGLPANDGAER